MRPDYRIPVPPMWVEALPSCFTKELWTPPDNSISIREVPTEVLEAELKARGRLLTTYSAYRLDHMTLRYLNDPGFLDYSVRHNRRQLAMTVAEGQESLEVRSGDGHIELIHSMTTLVPEKTDATPLSERVAAAHSRSYGLRAGL